MGNPIPKYCVRFECSDKKARIVECNDYYKCEECGYAYGEVAETKEAMAKHTCYHPGCDKTVVGVCRECRKSLCEIHDWSTGDDGHYWCGYCASEKPLDEEKLKADEAEAVEESQNILYKAQKIVDGPRQLDYGKPAENYLRVAAMWTVILGKSVSPRAVCQCMIALKLVRDSHSPKEDNLIDIAGYARIMEIIEKESHGF